MQAETVDGFSNEHKWENVEVKVEGYTPWHLSVFSYKSVYYAIVACVKHGEKQRCWQMLGKFNDNLSQLKIFNTPLCDYNSYRGAALVDHSGEFILYNTTVHERIKGSKAVDGRDVVLAHKPFDEVLKIVNSNG